MPPERTAAQKAGFRPACLVMANTVSECRAASWLSTRAFAVTASVSRT